MLFTYTLSPARILLEQRGLSIASVAAEIVKLSRGAYRRAQIEDWINDQFPVGRTHLNCNLLVALASVLNENPQNLYLIEPDFASATGRHRPGHDPDEEAELLLTLWRSKRIRVHTPTPPGLITSLLTKRDKEIFDEAWQRGMGIGDICRELLGILTTGAKYHQLRAYAKSQGCDLRARGNEVARQKRTRSR